MTREVFVYIDAAYDMIGNFEDKFEIVTKSEILRVKILKRYNQRF